LLQESQIQVLGFDYIKELFEEDTYFKEAFEACKHPPTQDRIPWLDSMIQYGLLFKNDQLCILNYSMRENRIKEKHNGVLGGHFG